LRADVSGAENFTFMKMQPFPISSSFARLWACLPDLASALFCLTAWVAPQVIGPHAFNMVVAMMAVEFLLIHGAVMFTALAGAMADAPRWLRWSSVAAPLLVYLIFLIPVARSIGQWWPLSVFLWMIYSKMQGAYPPRAQASMRWLFSVGIFMAAVFGTMLLPLPRLGFTPQLIAQLAGSSSGTWAEKPQSLVAAMLIYYIALSIYQWRSSGRPPAQLAVGKHR
jgi:hypothetical protein